MKSAIKNILKEAKKRLKKDLYLFEHYANKFFSPQKQALDFDTATLPFLDRPEYSFAELNKQIAPLRKITIQPRRKTRLF